MILNLKAKTFFSILFFAIFSSVQADDVVYNLKISKNLFYPDTIVVPTGVRFKLVIENQDETPEEFDSFDLNREKVIMGNATATIYIGPLQTGTYPFFGEFNPETAQGKIVVTPDIVQK